MGLVVRTNMTGINTSNALNKNTKKLGKSMQKLASGFKINSAADDASGLSISEKMRNQITALDTYDGNTEDGVSLVQTAEGAMAEVSEMLQRGFELSAKSTNGVLDDDDRKILQHEIDEIVDEVDRISVTTKFNNIQLLRGKVEMRINVDWVPVEVEYEKSVAQYDGKLPAWADIDADSKKDKMLAATYTDSDGKEYYATTLDFSAFKPDDISSSVGTGFHTTCCTCDNNYSIEFTDDATSGMERIGSQINYKIGIANAQTGEDIYDAILKATTEDWPINHYTNVVKDNGKLVIFDNREKRVKPRPDFGFGVFDEGYVNGEVKQKIKGLQYETKYETEILSDTRNLYINSGESQVGDIHITLPDMTIENLGIDKVDITTVDNANESMDIFKKSLSILSAQRGVLGAQQNRMEHAIIGIRLTHENTSAAHSRIKDTDMAKEMMNNTSQNIMSQASQSMLAQANAHVQDILSLIQQ